MPRRLFDEDAGKTARQVSPGRIRQVQRKESIAHAEADDVYIELAIEMGLPLINQYAAGNKDALRIKAGGLELFFSHGVVVGFKWRGNSLRLSMNPGVRGISTQRHLEALESQYNLGIGERVEVDQFRRELLSLLEMLRIS